MGWNYRVMRHLPDSAYPQQGGWYAIHEVFYKDDAVEDCTVDSSETRFTQDSIAPLAGDISELRWVLEQMLAALDKPVLEYRDGPYAEPDASADGGRDPGS